MIADNSQHLIKHIGDEEIVTRSGDDLVLHRVYHVPTKMKNLLSICQITRSGCYVLFKPNDMKIYNKIKAKGTTMMARKRRRPCM